MVRVLSILPDWVKRKSLQLRPPKHRLKLPGAKRHCSAKEAPMSQQLPCSRSSNHVLTWSISIGLLFAAISGIGIQSSGEHYQGETWAKFRPVFAPETA